MKLLAFMKPYLLVKRLRFIKLLRIMKLSIFIILAACLTANADGYSQRISISLENASVQKVFESIRLQSGYKFLYTNKVITHAKPIRISVKDATLDQELEICFKDQPLSYTIIENTIVVKLEKSIDSKEKEESLAEPPIEIKGRIINDKGEPMAGVSVKIKSTSIGTTTNNDGYFQIQVPDEKTVLEFSYVGFISKSFAVR